MRRLVVRLSVVGRVRGGIRSRLIRIRQRRHHRVGGSLSRALLGRIRRCMLLVRVHRASSPRTGAGRENDAKFRTATMAGNALTCTCRQYTFSKQVHYVDDNAAAWTANNTGTTRECFVYEPRRGERKGREGGAETESSRRRRGDGRGEEERGGKDFDDEAKSPTSESPGESRRNNRAISSRAWFYCCGHGLW
jgi:hypothetical protein